MESARQPGFRSAPWARGLPGYVVALCAAGSDWAVATTRSHAWTLLIAVPFILLSYLLPLPPLPLAQHRFLAPLGIGLCSLIFAAAAAIYRQGPLAWRRLPGVLVACVAAQWFFDAFLRWKAYMPTMRPFSWDERLAAADQAIHGGVPLALRLEPILGGPATLQFLDHAYYVWFPVMAGVILWQAWSDDRERARRFALALVTVWIALGVVAAYGLSSAGPMFLFQLTGDRQFLPLLRGLSAAGMLETTVVAHGLWSYWIRLHASSIAAMPSLHVAIPVLCACVSRRWLRWTFVAYTGIVFLGSIMLGWHFAVDGYVGAAGALAVWWVSGRALAVSGETVISPLSQASG